MADLLNDLTSGEDEFDVDLMAAGCRVRIVSEPPDTINAHQLVALYQFDAAGLEALLTKLIEDGALKVTDAFRAAEEIAAGRAAK